MDVEAAFVDGKLDKEVYMQQPKCYIDEKIPDPVCKLHKRFYGLKQASTCQNSVIEKHFKDSGYIQNKADPCVLVKNITKNNKKSIMIIAIYWMILSLLAMMHR